jgi:phage shock protein C
MTDEFPEPTFPPGPSLEPPAEPRLRRSRTDRVFAGVCGGLGHYFRIDPVILRIVMVALIFAGVGLIAYLIAWIAIPEAAEGEPEAPIPARNQRATAVVLGTSLLAVGGLLLMRATMPWFHGPMFWPLVVIAGGAAIVATSRR